jgi:hypothetical protein
MSSSATKTEFKHQKYKNFYKPNNLYWGIGIENELYLEFEKKVNVPKDIFLTNHKKERYCIDYYTNYKKEYINDSFNFSYLNLIKNRNLSKNYKHRFSIIGLLDINALNRRDSETSIDNSNASLHLPLLINSHSFLDTDKNNNPKKIYSKLNEENKKFSGSTLLDDLLNFNNYFKYSYQKEWLFDGDTIEFTTLNFYNNTLYKVIGELNFEKQTFVKNLQKFQNETKIFQDYGLIRLMTHNYPFSIYLTNLNNIGIFNNGTLHYNLTLPTFLDKNKLIKDRIKFINDHKKAIKIIQYMEPFLISVYNTPDYFASNSTKFSNCSQRCAMSRYIGLGTYNSDDMIPGKILTLPLIVDPKLWYNKYHQNSGYSKLYSVGLDINFNKHYNHGIEIRFFDHITDNNMIIESFEFIIYLMDFILDLEDYLDNPIINSAWHDLIYKVIIYGNEYTLNKDEILLYELLFEMKIKVSNIKEVYYHIYYTLLLRFSNLKKIHNKYYIYNKGKYSKLVLGIKEIDIDTYNKINKYVPKTFYNYVVNTINYFVEIIFV